MPRPRLEPGGYPPKDQINPIYGADGVWRIPQIWHRAWSGERVRSSGTGATKRACLDSFNANFAINVDKGSVKTINTRRRRWTTADKMTDAFEHWMSLQEQKVQRGKLGQSTYDDYHRFVYRGTGPRAKKDAVRLETEMGRLTVGEAGRPVLLADHIDNTAAETPGLALMHHVILTSTFAMLTLGGAFDKSPMDVVPAPESGTGGDQRALLMHEIAQLPSLWTPRRTRWIQAAVLTELGTGVRSGEARALRRMDVSERDEQGRIVAYVGGTIKSPPHAQPYRQAWRKRGPNYWLTLPLWLSETLTDWLETTPGEPEDLLFVSSRTQGPISGPSAVQALATARRDGPLDWLCWGHFRDTAATVIDEHYDDSRRSSAQLGQSAGQSIATKHYIDKSGRTRVVVDNTAALEVLWPNVTTTGKG